MGEDDNTGAQPETQHHTAMEGKPPKIGVEWKDPQSSPTSVCHGSSGLIQVYGCGEYSR